MSQPPRRQVRNRGSGDYNGLIGWLVGSAGGAVGAIGLAWAGFDFPAGLADLFARLTLVPLIQLTFAWVATLSVAMAAAALVVWVGKQVGIGYPMASAIAEVAAVFVTMGLFVALAIAGESWWLLAAASIVVSFGLMFLIDAATGRLRRASPLDK